MELVPYGGIIFQIVARFLSFIQVNSNVAPSPGGVLAPAARERRCSTHEIDLRQIRTFQVRSVVFRAIKVAFKHKFREL